MDDTEAKQLAGRITRFNQLKERAQHIRWALAAMEEPKVLMSGPFTGNTRESRHVDSIRVRLTPTLGGAPAVEIELKELDVPAYEFGQWLRGNLERQLETVATLTKEA